MTVSQSTIDASLVTCDFSLSVGLHIIIAKKIATSRPTFASYHEVSDHVVLIDQLLYYWL